MRSVETFRLRVKLFNLQGRISEKYMEIRWLGERAQLSTLPLSVYPWREDSQTIAHSVFLVRISTLVRISMARRLPVISHSGWATVKLGTDLGGVFSKGPEQANFCLQGTRTGILFSHFRPYLPLMLSLRRQIPLRDVSPLEWGV